MRHSDRIFIPNRIADNLREIYRSQITVICAPDGTGKSTLLRGFTRRSRPEGVSLRFIRTAKSSGECFAQISSLITGEALDEPLTDSEFSAIFRKFGSAPEKPLVIIVDCAAAPQTLFGNIRTARLLAECGRARFVFVCTSLKPGYRKLAQDMGFRLIEREQLCMNIREIRQFAALYGANVNPSEVYAVSNGSFLSTRSCLILAMRGQDYLNLTTEGRIIKAAVAPGSVRLYGALAAVSLYPDLSEHICRDLRSFRPITDYFGEDLFTPDNILSEIEKMNRVIPLAEINRRTHEINIHPVLRHAVYSLFSHIPDSVQHDLRICFAREFQRREQYFGSFCEYFLAGEYELAAGVHIRSSASYSLLMKYSRLLLRFVTECPLECKPAVPRIMQMTAMLTHTDSKQMISGRLSQIAAHISSSDIYDSSERRILSCYAFALRANEDLYSLDKMGVDIKRAYDLFKSSRRYESPLLPWTMYAPSVFCLLHRRGYSLQTENDRFTRYQQMYTEMLGHGGYAQLVFTGEMKYYLGDLSGGLELLSAAVSRCSGEKHTAMRLAALYAAAKCCLYLGEYIRFFELLGEIHAIERSHIGGEESGCAKLCLGMLRALRGGGTEDMWYVLNTEETDILYNRYTAPYFAMTKAIGMLMHGKNEQLAGCCDSFIGAAAAAGNEPAGVKLRMFGAQAYLSLRNYDKAIALFREALEAVRDGFIPTTAAEIYTMYPDIFSQLYTFVPESLRPVIDRAEEMGMRLQRGTETVRTYELTYLFNNSAENYAEHYLIPLYRLIASTDEQRRALGLSNAAYSYAIMAASGISNSEISNLFSVSENSVKSSLKRTFSALGVNNRRELIGIVPTLK